MKELANTVGSKVLEFNDGSIMIRRDLCPLKQTHVQHFAHWVEGRILKVRYMDAHFLIRIPKVDIRRRQYDNGLNFDLPVVEILQKPNKYEHSGFFAIESHLSDHAAKYYSLPKVTIRSVDEWVNKNPL